MWIIVAVVFGGFDMEFFFGTMSLWMWVVAAGHGFYCFKEEKEAKRKRERNEE